MIQETIGVSIKLSQVQYTGPDGKLVTESYADYTRHTLHSKFPTLESFLSAWFHAERKQAIVAELYYQGIIIDKLQEAIGMDLDAFDLICHLAFDRKTPRRERANNARSQPGYFEKYGKAAHKVLEMLVNKFAEDGYMTLDKVLDDVLLKHSFSTPPFAEFESPRKMFHAFGGKAKFRAAMRELQNILYQD